MKKENKRGAAKPEESAPMEEKKEVKLGAPVERICGCGTVLQIVEGGPLVKCTNCTNLHN